jgi:hypothetical protein
MRIRYDTHKPLIALRKGVFRVHTKHPLVDITVAMLLKVGGCDLQEHGHSAYMIRLCASYALVYAHERARAFTKGSHLGLSAPKASALLQSLRGLRGL